MLFFKKVVPQPTDQREITLSELRRHDGDRGPAYVAYRGQVYDVSASGEWRFGLHRDLHWAGQDLTDEIADAPHGEETLLRFAVVGVLVDERPSPPAQAATSN